VGVALGKTGVLGRIEARVHTGQDREMPPRRQGKMALVETRRVRLISAEHFVQDLAHIFFSSEIVIVYDAACSSSSRRTG
jgi:hypothetical protein